MPPLSHWIPYWHLVPPGGGCRRAPEPVGVERLVRRIENRDRAKKSLVQRTGDIMPRNRLTVESRTV